MNFLESIKMAVKTLAANKLRSSLTMLGIIIGNSSVIAMIGIGQGVQNYSLAQLESYGSNLLSVFAGSEEAEYTSPQKRVGNRGRYFLSGGIKIRHARTYLKYPGGNDQ